MKDGSRISYKEIASRLLTSKNCVRNIQKTFKQMAFNVIQNLEGKKNVRPVFFK